MTKPLIVSALGIPALALLFFACSSSDGSDGREADGGDGDTTLGDGDGGDGDGVDDGLSTSGEADSGADPAVDGGEGGAGGAASGSDVPARVAPPEPKQPPQGQLTSGIFDDNLSFSFFKRYRESLIASQTSGLVDFTLDDHEAAQALYAGAQQSHTDLDASLVIDTTGSMGDELDYLKNELSTITDAISDLFPQAEQRWSLVVYRDEGDEYVARAQNFTTDLQEFQSILSVQQYGGGGDFPEAPDEGLAAANQLDWRTEDGVARMIFWVADAPHHTNKADAMKAAIEGAQLQDIHIYPVASSGIDEFTEYTMRASAQLTLGRYLFLTNDSGLGNSHKEPTLPCYYVTTLRDAIVRGVSTEMTGQHTPPAEESVIRLGGSLNEEGNCFYGDGYEAKPF
jgi:hypothetical protein